MSDESTKDPSWLDILTTGPLILALLMVVRPDVALVALGVGMLVAGLIFYPNQVITGAQKLIADLPSVDEIMVKLSGSLRVVVFSTVATVVAIVIAILYLLWVDDIETDGLVP